jgi:hypothetical protein
MSQAEAAMRDPQIIATLYAEYIGSIKALIDRRDRQSYFYFLANAAYFVAMSFVLSQISNNLNAPTWLRQIEQIIFIAICGIGIISSVFWMHQVHVFHNVLAAKFRVLCELERNYMVPIHDMEYDVYSQKAHRLAGVLHAIAVGAILIYGAIFLYIAKQLDWAVLIRQLT